MIDDDSKLQHRLADTLERSLDELDEQTVQQLQSIRLQVQQPQQHRWRPALAIAASILVMVAIPWMMQKPGTTAVPAPLAGAPLAVESYLTVDPEMLADWEMLEAIGEVPDA